MLLEACERLLNRLAWLYHYILTSTWCGHLRLALSEALPVSELLALPQDEEPRPVHELRGVYR